MGFLKFLKREKKGSELDLPPAPPPLEGFEEKLPELPEMPEIDKISAPEDFKFDFPEEKEFEIGKEEPMQDMPELPEYPEVPSMQPASMPPPQTQEMPETHPMEQPMEEIEQQTTMQSGIFPKHERGLFVHEKKERVLPRYNSVYVRVDKFKAMLGSINVVRGDLRKADEVLMKMENVKMSKDKSFDKVKSSLEDLQKKLIFIDRTLFRGE